MKSFVLSAAIAAVTMLGTATGALAEWKPNGPIKLMIAFAAGGGADTIARAVGDELQKRHGWEIQPQQVTGGGGLKLAAAMKSEPSDGTTIGMAITESYGYNMVANPGAGITLADVTPLTTVAGFQMGVVAKTSKGWKTIDDVIAAAKAGETLRFGTMTPKLSDLAFLLSDANNLNLNIVEVKGGKAVMNGVNAGDLDLGFMAGIQAKGVASGDLVNLASALTVPLAQTPEAPLMMDRGVPFGADGYFLFAAPPGLDPAARKALTDAIIEVVSDPSTKAGGIIKKAFGGTSIIKGSDVEALLEADVKAAKELIKAAQ
ncbi:MAG: tripartite tricarboxylate transporter substrate-binding protein [Alphaproteobacteria bacterium]|nr:tripartite tricarboxylate transporter substrate-binding protein [Alphaproteobacteria bacterium]